MTMRRLLIIGDLQVSQVAAACSCAIEGHQYYAMRLGLGRVDDLVLGELDRELERRGAWLCSLRR
jgi:hypothetical protein